MNKHFISRKVISKIASFIIKILFGSKVIDVNVPYRLMKLSTFKPLFLMVSNNSLSPNIIITGLVNFFSLKIYKTNVPYNFRSTGEVSIKHWKLFWVSFRILIQLICFRIKLFLK